MQKSISALLRVTIFFLSFLFFFAWVGYCYSHNTISNIPSSSIQKCTRNKMLQSYPYKILLLILLSSSCLVTSREFEDGSSVKTSVFLSPSFFLKPGSVEDRFYFDIPFPRGHIALKSFNGEVIDENNNPIPLHETYLHHWVVDRYYGQKGAVDNADTSKIILVRNSGTCKSNIEQYFGLGSETRKTNTWVPDPYGIEVGNPTEIPDGYEERWLLNIHAIDTRGVDDRLGCSECKCSDYNVTKDRYGRPLANGYVGGLLCCYDKTQCRMREGFTGSIRKLYLRYTVKWEEWHPSIVPVKIYILDVTDTGEHPSDSSAVDTHTNCKVEYTVQPCDSAGERNGECVDVKKTQIILPHGGDIIYGVAHQHTGGAGSALYGEDGHVLCNSIPFYGKGEAAGDESGYIVGMSTCYPEPSSVKVRNGEILTLVSNYSSTQMHTGVMGLFYILVAEPKQPLKAMISHGIIAPWILELAENWWVVVLAGGIVIVVAVSIYGRRHDAESYQMVIN